MTNAQLNKPAFPKKPFGGDKKWKDNGKSFIRKNEKIRAKEVRVIDSDGQQLGILPTSEAVLMAKRQGLDLIEISPNANPPVCKILDFGKYKYEESKKNKNSPKQNTVKVKEIKLRVAIDTNDYQIKLKHASEFLEEGNKVKLSLMFRGRELAHPEFGFDLIKRFVDDIKTYGQLDSEPKLFGKAISAVLSPYSKKQQPQKNVAAQPKTTFAKILDASDLLKLK